MHTADLLTFTAVAAGLPGVKPRATQSWLRELYWTALLQDAEFVDVAGLQVPVAEMAQAFVEHDSGSFKSERVSPAGARLLLRLYRSGKLETKSKRIAEPTPALLAYCDSDEQLQDEARRRAEHRAQEEAAFEARLANPASIAVSDFSYAMLNALFWRHNIKQGSLLVGEVTVTKSVSQVMSNSGKSVDFDVSFSWTDSTGQLQEIRKPSRFAGNRRNDEKRNYGLPE